MTPEDITPLDYPAVGELHSRAGFDYRMPDLGDSKFVVKKGIWDGGRLQAACGIRLQAETYLWVDPALPVRLRYKLITALSKAVVEASWRVGLDCLSAWLPPNLPRSFHRFLNKLGWSRDRDGWETWSLFK